MRLYVSSARSDVSNIESLTFVDEEEEEEDEAEEEEEEEEEEDGGVEEVNQALLPGVKVACIVPSTTSGGKEEEEAGRRVRFAVPISHFVPQKPPPPLEKPAEPPPSPVFCYEDSDRVVPEEACRLATLWWSLVLAAPPLNQEKWALAERSGENLITACNYSLALAGGRPEEGKT